MELVLVRKKDPFNPEKITIKDAIENNLFGVIKYMKHRNKS